MGRSKKDEASNYNLDLFVTEWSILDMMTLIWLANWLIFK